ncbi:hypothetical protein CBOM_00251 [Ceraceosorus bombacis]|uniref:Uncharacterized protein n=1 Tax=Ceraceosorus bombacis TaxID=401625 RepID=A0A0P1A4H7_9BASI|nr:hypothetical protein CBOM_00251 [Ceraceosorus bombacis]
MPANNKDYLPSVMLYLAAGIVERKENACPEQAQTKFDFDILFFSASNRNNGCKEFNPNTVPKAKMLSNITPYLRRSSLRRSKLRKSRNWQRRSPSDRLLEANRLLKEEEHNVDDDEE